jgi:hypothetical protein
VNNDLIISAGAIFQLCFGVWIGWQWRQRWVRNWWMRYFREHPKPKGWEITVTVPVTAGEATRERIFTAIAVAAFDAEPLDRDDWDINVSVGPVAS